MPAGATETYALADSWNLGSASGATGAIDRSNNLFHLKGLTLTGANSGAPATRDPAQPAK